MRKCLSIILVTLMTTIGSVHALAHTITCTSTETDNRRIVEEIVPDDQYETYINTEFYKTTVYPDKKETRADSNQPTLPLANYPDGSHFSINYSSGCTCHGNCSYWGGCDCISYNGGIQCFGFANFVFSEYTGEECVDSNSGGTVYFDNVSELKSFFLGLSKGAHVRYVSTSGIQHSIIVISAGSSSVKIYDANFVKNNCEVDVRYDSYDTLFNRISYVKKYWEA